MQSNTGWFFQYVLWLTENGLCSTHIISAMMWKQTNSLKWQINIVSVQTEHTLVTRSFNVQQRAVLALFVRASLLWLPTAWLTRSYFSHFPAKFAVPVATAHLTNLSDLKNWLSSTSSDTFASCIGVAPHVHPKDQFRTLLFLSTCAISGRTQCWWPKTIKRGWNHCRKQVYSTKLKTTCV